MCGPARALVNGYESVSAGALTSPGRIGPLTDAEKTWAKAAWRYVANNTQPATGLASSVDRYPATTLWQIGDYLGALVAARELGLIDRIEFDHRLAKLLGFLSRMPLLDGDVPNKTYNTQSGVMVNDSNQPGAVGASAIDVGRLLVWLKITGQRYPEYAEYLDKVVLRLNVCGLVGVDGTLYGSRADGNRLARYREGRLGYEQYASAGFNMWGVPVAGAAASPVQTVYVDGVSVYVDARDPRTSGAPNPVVSEPYLLLGMEFGWDDRVLGNVPQPAGVPGIHEQAQAVYLAQAARWRNEKVITARTDHQLGQAPYFLYDSIFANGYPWNTLGEDGKSYPALALVSTRAAFGMWVLWRTTYTSELMRSIDALYDPERGWHEGRYEASGAYEETATLSTNAMVLEALLYKARGRLAASEQRAGYFDARLSDRFAPAGRCLLAHGASFSGASQ
jgi:hypothetical protein